MSLSLNNPLIIGDINKKTKEDISQLQQDIGDMSQLETADKSSLVNALNEAIDSTLNGASRDLDNLSDTGNDKLRSLNSYANEGELLTDPDGLSFVEKYAHSTFDRSKFTVVGSPNITDDGIASGFSSSNYLTIGSISALIYQADAWSIECKFKTKTIGANNFIIANATQNNFKAPRLWYKSDGKMHFDISFDGTNPDGALIGTTVLSENTTYYAKVEFTGTQYKLLLSTDGINYNVEAQNSSSDKCYNDGSINAIGIHYSSNSPFLGSIDLKQFSITVDGVEVFSGNKTGIDTIKPDDYTVVGTPTISADGIASGFNDSNYIYTPEISFGTTSFDIDVCFNSTQTQSSYNRIVQSGNIGTTNNLGINLNLRPEGTLNWEFRSLNTGYTGNRTITNYIIQNNTNYWVKISYKNGVFTVKISTDGEQYTQIDIVNANVTENVICNNIIGRSLPTGNRAFQGSVDLNAFKIYVDGDLVYQPCLKIPYTESKTGSKVVNSIYRDRVNDMATQFGYANYYTLSDTDFTLPQVELYGLIGQRTLRDSYRNGINYWELYSNRDLEQGGSCTSGVEVTFARPFADTNYVLSVPYSAKSSTAFTPTQTGDWIAKGKGIL